MGRRQTHGAKGHARGARAAAWRGARTWGNGSRMGQVACTWGDVRRMGRGVVRQLCDTVQFLQNRINYSTLVPHSKIPAKLHQLFPNCATQRNSCKTASIIPQLCHTAKFLQKRINLTLLRQISDFYPQKDVFLQHSHKTAYFDG
ncbi:hypothetical protein [Paenibacillus thiaminolyticus]|uniref:hypothetical protein n=1 Tax=Paenibacillus thiaminolyticus TaxID=49283 RepID=UPI0011C34C33|nr:hypothetical protein [Paenibacillus thiaminolyticus]